MQQQRQFRWQQGLSAAVVVQLTQFVPGLRVIGIWARLLFQGNCPS